MAACAPRTQTRLMLLSRANASAISTYKFAVLWINRKTQEACGPGRKTRVIKESLERWKTMQGDLGDDPGVAERDK